ncbi:MAG: hypothetical protein QM500_09405 [Methylococcales bacterium]
MEFQQVDITGCRLIGAITKIGHAGPKHHGIVIGRNIDDQKIYIAEHCHTGYKLTNYNEFVNRYSVNGDIQISPNDGAFSDIDVAKRALKELTSIRSNPYNLFSNNCESFSNRAMHDNSISQQVINTLAVTAFCIAGVWLIKQAQKG